MTPLETLIRDVQKELKESDLVKYRADQQTRTDLYCGNYERHLKRKLAERMPLTADQMNPLWLNPYRKVVDERAAGLYRTPPARVLIGQDGQEIPDSEALIDLVIDRKTLNVKLDKAARYLEAHRTILISVVWRHSRIELDVLTPPLFHVDGGEPDETCLEDAEWVSVHVGDCKTLVWDAGEHTGTPQFILFENKTGELIEVGDNPYFDLGPDGKTWRSVFPFVLMQAEDPDTDLYIPGGDDLVRAALHVGFTLTDTEFVERFQAYGQPVFNGVDKTVVADMEIGPNSAIALGAVGQESFAFVTPPQMTTGRMESLGRFLQMLSYFYDLPVDTFDETRLPTSGTAMRISRKKLGQYRSDLAERMAVFEERLFSIMRAVRNAHVAEQDRTPWNFGYKVTPKPQEIPLDLSEQDARNAGRIALGLDSAVEIIMREQGVSEDRAREIVARNRADNGPAASAPTSGAAPMVPPPGGGILGQMRANLAARMAAPAPGKPGAAAPPPNAPPEGSDASGKKPGAAGESA